MDHVCHIIHGIRVPKHGAENLETLRILLQFGEYGCKLKPEEFVTGILSAKLLKNLPAVLQPLLSSIQQYQERCGLFFSIIAFLHHPLKHLQSLLLRSMQTAEEGQNFD